jgi:membrane-bound lytic murein transglycosylase D
MSSNSNRLTQKYNLKPMNPLKKLSKIFLIFFFCLMGTKSSVAQVSDSTQNITAISSMLDSLVTLNHVVRFNCLDANCFNSSMANTGVIPYFSDEEYITRMSKISCPIPLSYNRYVKDFIDLYAYRRRALTQRVMGLSNLYFPMYEEILDKEGLPLEFKYLSIIESALNPVAVSRVGATGLWQFMYSTGIIYDLKVNSFTDDRRDPVKSTYAACKYFKDMYSIYGDWLLVIASYNCGAGNVNKAIKRSGGKKNFWEIMQYLPAETRSYVPAFIAVTYVMNYSREHNLYPITPAYSYFQVDTINVTKQVNFNVLANQIDLPLDVISFLNPIYKKNYIPDTEESYTLRLPTNKIALYMAKEEQILALSTPPPKPTMPVVARAVVRDSSSTDSTTVAQQIDSSGVNQVEQPEVKTQYKYVEKKVVKTHIVRKNESLASVAALYGMSAAELKRMNRLRSNSLLKGQRLSVNTTVKVKVPIENNQAVNRPKPTQNNTVVVETSVKDSSLKTTNVEDKADTTTVAKVDQTTQVKQPKYVYHLVQPGDTLWNIAKRYNGVTIEMIKNINNLRSSQLKVGTKLKVLVSG